MSWLHVCHKKRNQTLFELQSTSWGRTSLWLRVCVNLLEICWADVTYPLRTCCVYIYFFDNIIIPFQPLLLSPYTFTLQNCTCTQMTGIYLTISFLGCYLIYLYFYSMDKWQEGKQSYCTVFFLIICHFVLCCKCSQMSYIYFSLSLSSHCETTKEQPEKTEKARDLVLLRCLFTEQDATRKNEDASVVGGADQLLSDTWT